MLRSQGHIVQGRGQGLDHHHHHGKLDKAPLAGAREAKVMMYDAKYRAFQKLYFGSYCKHYQYKIAQKAMSWLLAVIKCLLYLRYTKSDSVLSQERALWVQYPFFLAKNAHDGC